MEVLKFKDEKEYKEWLRHRSAKVEEKAKKFEQKYPGVIPIVLVFDVDTCAQCWDGGVHIFIPPWLEDIIDKIVGDYQ